jgi:hypothetical protein
MKFIWEEKDIEVGVQYSHNDTKEVWMIAGPAGAGADGWTRYVNVSISTGLVTPAFTKLELVEILNDGQYMPACCLGKK